MINVVEDTFKVNCSHCGTHTKTESKMIFNEDQTANCSCGNKLKFVRNFNDKKNTYAFED